MTCVQDNLLPFLPQRLLLFSPSQIKEPICPSYRILRPHFAHTRCHWVSAQKYPHHTVQVSKVFGLVTSLRPGTCLSLRLVAQVSTGVGALLSITDRWPKTAVGARSDQRRMAEQRPVVATSSQLGPQMQYFIASAFLLTTFGNETPK